MPNYTKQVYNSFTIRHNKQLSHHFWPHLLQLCDEISKELCHILLFTGVQWLLVHGISLAETLGVVRLSLTLLNNGPTIRRVTSTSPN